MTQRSFAKRAKNGAISSRLSIRLQATWRNQTCPSKMYFQSFLIAGLDTKCKICYTKK
jgi:hypothetical protein